MPNTTQTEHVYLRVYDQQVECGVDTEYKKEEIRVREALKKPHPAISMRM
jgi:hypothetical protein